MLNTVLEVICKTVAMPTNSPWPCSMHPIPRFRLVGGEDILYILNISWTPEFWTPLQIPLWEEPWLLPVPKVHVSSLMQCQGLNETQ